MKAVIVLASVALFLIFQYGNASSCNGNLVCEPGEDRGSCPSDCCLRVKNGVCSFYPDCALQDPDCCDSGCASSYQACLGNDRQSCAPGYCSGGSCANTCTSYLQCASGYCSSGTCAQRAAQNGVSADGGWSCANCFGAGACAPCNSACLSISSQGYAVYKGDAATIYYDISNRCGSPLSPVSLLVSGPLMRHSSLSAQSIQTLSNFETRRFSVTVSSLPAVAYGAYAPGEYELKVSAASGGQQASYVSTVFVLPSLVFSSGMEIPPNRIVGHSVREALMKQGSAVLPVELEVWAW